MSHYEGGINLQPYHNSSNLAKLIHDCQHGGVLLLPSGVPDTFWRLERVVQLNEQPPQSCQVRGHVPVRW